MLATVPTVQKEFPFSYTFDQWNHMLDASKPLSSHAPIDAPKQAAANSVGNAPAPPSAADAPLADDQLATQRGQR